MDDIEQTHTAGVRRHAGAWFTANKAAVVAAREGGLDPVKYQDAIALIVLRVLDVVAEGATVGRIVSFVTDLEFKRIQSKTFHDMAREMALIPGRERDANTISAEAARIDQELAQLEAALRAPAK